MPLTKASALFAWRSDFGPDPLVGGDPVYVRDSAGWWFDGRLYRRSITGPGGAAAPRFGPVEMDGVSRPAMLLELARAGQLVDPTDVQAAGWVAVGPPTFAGATSIIDGRTARKLTAGLNNHRVAQVSGVLTGSSETTVVIIESVPGDESTQTQLLLWDNTTSSVVGGVNIDTSTGTVGDPSAATIREIAASGPNGGTVWRVERPASGTAGNSREVRLYPDRSGGNRSVIVHYINHEEAAFGTSPIPDSTATRAVGSFHWKGAPRPQAMVAYGRMNWALPSADGGLNQPGFWSIGRSASTPAIMIYGAASNRIWLWHNNGSETVTSIAAVAPTRGIDVEWTSVLNGDGSIKLVVRADGVITSATASSAPVGGLATAWADDALRLNVQAAKHGAGRYTRHHIVKLADLDSATDGTADEALMDELASYDYLTAEAA